MTRDPREERRINIQEERSGNERSVEATPQMIQALGAAGALGAVGGRSGPAAQGGKIKVGFMLPYTGTFAALGRAIENGFKLYVSEQGGKLGGREIEYFKVDDESEPVEGGGQRQQADQARQRGRHRRHRAFRRADGDRQGAQAKTTRC